jgi:glycosyltransferase involved in cell wall biosynthesis
MKTVTIVTPTTGNPIIKKCIQSVRNQTYAKNITHLVIVDGPENWRKVDWMLADLTFPTTSNKEYVNILPWSIGKDRWNGHRIYAAASYMIDTDYIIFLDEDNYLEPNHVEECIKTIDRGNDWCFSFRKIVDKEGTFLCNDDCESLGKWASVLHEEDFFIDVNCYFIPRQVAVQLTPVWYRKAREQPEVDRLLAAILRKNLEKFDSTYQYSVNYTVGNNPVSVQDSFFIQGNQRMLQKYNGKLPWVKQ